MDQAPQSHQDPEGLAETTERPSLNLYQPAKLCVTLLLSIVTVLLFFHVTKVQ